MDSQASNYQVSLSGSAQIMSSARIRVDVQWLLFCPWHSRKTQIIITQDNSVRAKQSRIPRLIKNFMQEELKTTCKKSRIPVLVKQIKVLPHNMKQTLAISNSTENNLSMLRQKTNRTSEPNHPSIKTASKKPSKPTVAMTKTAILRCQKQSQQILSNSTDKKLAKSIASSMHQNPYPTSNKSKTRSKPHPHTRTKARDSTMQARPKQKSYSTSPPKISDSTSVMKSVCNKQVVNSSSSPYVSLKVERKRELPTIAKCTGKLKSSLGPQKTRQC